MIDRIFTVVAVVGLLVLAFLAGSYVVLAQRFPYEPLEHAAPPQAIVPSSL